MWRWVRDALLAVSLWCRAPAVAPAPEPTAAAVACARTVTNDADEDGLSDACELTIARAFAPRLAVDASDCLWRPGEERLGGGYLFVVQPVGDGIRIVYILAYYRDCGWSGARCWFRGKGCGSHAGDSEFIALDLRPSAAGWVPAGVFLSAHCGGASAAACRWYRGAALAHFRWGAGEAVGPEVWVARNKHAHYASRAACEAGNWRQERCAAAPVRVPYPLANARQNLGARGRSSYGHRGCVPAGERPVTGADVDSTAVECFWQDSVPFRGWQGVQDGPPPRAYGRILAQLGL